MTPNKKVSDATAMIEAWRVDYNTVRPHSALGNRTPEQFARTTEGARRLLPPRAEEKSTSFTGAGGP
jgi:putative transposase